MGAFLEVIAKLRKVTIRFVMAICPHGTTRLSHFHEMIFEDFLKICRENSSFVEIGQE
jgi:hypothetical protein